MSGVKQLLPAENALILNNGRRIGYKQLVLATGIKHDFTQIKGFYDALEDPEHPVYASKGKHIYLKIAQNSQNNLHTNTLFLPEMCF